MSKATLPKTYFDTLYTQDADPWSFETSAYERSKYAHTIAALPQLSYKRAFEIGCSNGELTKLLATKCQELLAVDGSAIPLERAKAKLAGRSNVAIQQMMVPQRFPTDPYDLIVLSEVGYYWSRSDLEKAATKISQHLTQGGTLLLVHYILETNYPLTGDEVHQYFLDQPGYTHQAGSKEEAYRLDVLIKR